MPDEPEKKKSVSGHKSGTVSDSELKTLIDKRKRRKKPLIDEDGKHIPHAARSNISQISKEFDECFNKGANSSAAVKKVREALKYSASDNAEEDANISSSEKECSINCTTVLPPEIKRRHPDEEEMPPMRLDSLGLDDELVEAYERRGIEYLYPPQAECVRKGLLDGKNLLISIPTASGKTLVAETAMHRHIRGIAPREGISRGYSGGGKCLYIVPLKALASEKYEEFAGRGVKVGIATGDLDRTDEYLGRNDIIVTTSEKADSLLRNNAQWMKLVTCLVVDEAHLIDSEDRGAVLEMVITKLRYANPGMQIIALTATIGNPKVFAQWLDADHISSDWRPVNLKEGVFYNGTIYFAEDSRKIESPSKEDDINLCLDCIKEGGQCLVFVSSRRNAEGFAKRMAKALEKAAESYCTANSAEDSSKKSGRGAASSTGNAGVSRNSSGAAQHPSSGAFKTASQIENEHNGISDGSASISAQTAEADGESDDKSRHEKYIDSEKLKDLSEKLESVAETDMGRILAACTAKGASFHHAGMKRDQRALIEQGFRDGIIKVISSTPTLAAGLNLPARRVVIRDYTRFKAGEGMALIPVREYRQMAGRAGRPHLDPYGESVLIAKVRNQANSLFEEFIDAPAENVTSRLDDESALCSQILSLIATGFVRTKDELLEFLKKTFYAATNKKSAHLSGIVSDCIEYLENADMIVNVGDNYSATPYGSLVSRLYINPISAEIITSAFKSKRSELESSYGNEGVNGGGNNAYSDSVGKNTSGSSYLRSSHSGSSNSGSFNSGSYNSGSKPVPDYYAEGNPVFSDLGLLQLLCKTPDMHCLYVKKDDIPVLESYYTEHESELWCELSYDSIEEDYCALKTAMLLNNWVNEEHESLICTRYNVGPGDVYNAVESMNWLCYSAARIAAAVVPDFKEFAGDLEIRMKNGVKRELLPLIRLKNIGRVRARRLFNSGFTTPEILRSAKYEAIAAILGDALARQILAQIDAEGAVIRRKDYDSASSSASSSSDRRIDTPGIQPPSPLKKQVNVKNAHSSNTSKGRADSGKKTSGSEESAGSAGTGKKNNASAGQKSLFEF